MVDRLRWDQKSLSVSVSLRLAGQLFMLLGLFVAMRVDEAFFGVDGRLHLTHCVTETFGD